MGHHNFHRATVLAIERDLGVLVELRRRNTGCQNLAKYNLTAIALDDVAFGTWFLCPQELSIGINIHEHQRALSGILSRTLSL